MIARLRGVVVAAHQGNIAALWTMMINDITKERKKKKVFSSSSRKKEHHLLVQSSVSPPRTAARVVAVLRMRRRAGDGRQQLSRGKKGRPPIIRPSSFSSGDDQQSAGHKMRTGLVWVTALSIERDKKTVPYTLSNQDLPENPNIFNPDIIQAGAPDRMRFRRERRGNEPTTRRQYYYCYCYISLVLMSMSLDVQCLFVQCFVDPKKRQNKMFPPAQQGVQILPQNS
jgi:hypothetical protein